MEDTERIQRLSLQVDLVSRRLRLIEKLPFDRKVCDSQLAALSNDIQAARDYHSRLTQKGIENPVMERIWGQIEKHLSELDRYGSLLKEFPRDEGSFRKTLTEMSACSHDLSRLQNELLAVLSKLLRRL